MHFKYSMMNVAFEKKKQLIICLQVIVRKRKFYSQNQLTK